VGCPLPRPTLTPALRTTLTPALRTTLTPAFRTTLTPALRTTPLPSWERAQGEGRLPWGSAGISAGKWRAAALAVLPWRSCDGRASGGDPFAASASRVIASASCLPKRSYLCRYVTVILRDQSFLAHLRQLDYLRGGDSRFSAPPHDVCGF
jgi:hypothetical protein